MLPVDDILAGLDLTRAQPGLGLLEALFARFNARVPFENASKLLRNEQIADPAEKPRWPSIFWEEHLELGTGGTCFARVAAFDALLRALEFSTRKILGRVEQDCDHAALLVSASGGLWICDVGFPLPALLAGREGELDTALSDLSVSSTPRGFRIDFLSGVPLGPRTVELFTEEVSEEAFRQRWIETFRPRSRFLSEVALRRQEASRIVSFSQGEIRVDDRHSRLRVPLAEPRLERLGELFEIDRELLVRAFALAEDSGKERRGSRLTAYLETRLSPEAAFAAVGTCQAYRSLIGGIAAITSEEGTESGWRLTLAAPGGEKAPPTDGGLLEEVSVHPARLAIRVRRSGPSAFESEFRVEPHAGRTFLVREAIFDSAREDLLRNDSLRGRLAGTLAVDLLAWARLLG